MSGNVTTWDFKLHRKRRVKETLVIFISIICCVAVFLQRVPNEASVENTLKQHQTTKIPNQVVQNALIKTTGKFSSNQPLFKDALSGTTIPNQRIRHSNGHNKNDGSDKSIQIKRREKSSSKKRSPIEKVEELNDLEFYKLMLERRAHLSQTCKQNSNIDKKSSIVAKNFYVLQEEKLIWCPVFKGASSTWMQYLLYIAGYSKRRVSEIKSKYPGQPNEQGRVVAPLVKKPLLQKFEKKGNVNKLLIVRHPFHRLVSGFRDKLERCHGPNGCDDLDYDWYYKIYGHRIVQTYRKRAIEKFTKQYFNKENNFGSPVPLDKNHRVSKLPTFWEFVQFIIDSPVSDYDEHWKPMYLHCSVCQFSFNYILHFENLQQEQTQFLKVIGKPNITQYYKHDIHKSGATTSDELVNKYFSTLDDEDIKKLYQIYKPDFQYFQYQFKHRNLEFNLQ